MEGVAFPLAKVKYPAQTLRITESWGGNGGSALAPMPNLPSGWWQILAPGWHNGWSCVLWVDGHASPMRASVDVIRTTTDPRNIMYDDGIPYKTGVGQVWCRLEGPKPSL